MKKSLSLLVAIAMVFSMFATVVSAADSNKPAGQYLQELGVIKGNASGDLLEDENWKRQDIIILLARLLGEEAEAKATAKSHEFTDVTDSFYDGFISWAVEEGLVEGKGNGKFGFHDELTNQEFYALVLRAFQVDTKGDAYAQVPELAIEWGLADEDTDFSADALRGGTYVTIVTALHTVVPGTGKTLGELLGYIVITDLAISTVAQTNKGEITVTFNKAASEDEQKELKATVKQGTVAYTVTSKWSEDGRELVLTSAYMPAGAYTVTVGEFAAVDVTVVDEVATKLEIGATSLQKAGNQDLKVKLYNQFNKEIANPSLNVTVYNATYNSNVQIPVVAGKVDLSSDAVARVNDTIVVTASTNAGLHVSKSYQVVAGSSATAITLTAPSPNTDKNRISVGETVVVPYTLTDQYGGKILLEQTSVTAITGSSFVISGINFIVNSTAIIDSYSVDANGVLSLKLGSTSGVAFLSAVNPLVTGAFASTQFNVEALASVKTISLQQPSTRIVADEDIIVPFTALDAFGQTVAGKDLGLNDPTKLVINSIGAPFANNYPRINAKGELVFRFASNPSADQNAHIIASINGIPAANLQFNVQKDAQPVKINGLNIAKTFAVGGQLSIAADQITYRDSYGRTQKVSALGNVTITLEGTGLLQSGANGQTLTGDAKGDAKVKIAYNTNTGILAGSEETFSISVIPAADVKNFSIKSIGTLYGGTDYLGGGAGEYAPKVVVVGKTIGGDEIVINQASAFDLITSSSPIVTVDNTAKEIAANNSGTAVIAVYKSGVKLAELEVTASKDKPIATTVSLDKGEYTLAANGADVPVVVTVKDQYGVELLASEYVGLLSSSNNDVVAITGTTTLDPGNKGVATITYITTTGATATATVLVD